ncbi:MAG: hypothetical protein ACRDZO_08375 [Egibacteraceae bacterium]
MWTDLDAEGEGAPRRAAAGDVEADRWLTTRAGEPAVAAGGTGVVHLLSAPAIAERTAAFVDRSGEAISWPGLLAACLAWSAAERLLVHAALDLWNGDRETSLYDAVTRLDEDNSPASSRRCGCAEAASRGSTVNPPHGFTTDRYAALAEHAIQTSEVSDDAESRMLNTGRAQAWAMLAVAAGLRELVEVLTARPPGDGA